MLVSLIRQKDLKTSVCLFMWVLCAGLFLGFDLFNLINFFESFWLVAWQTLRAKK